MIRLKTTTALFAVIVMLLILVSCDEQAEKTENNESPTNLIENSTENNSDTGEDEKSGEIIGDYQYPESPAEQLKSALESDANERELPLKIGSVEQVEFDGKAYSQLKIDFLNGNENACIITFLNKYLDYGYEESLDGHDNPSFTMAFKDEGNSQDMITLLTSVIKYISPDLSTDEAERIAEQQDNTISTDGYSMPQDIGGYQIQAHYTNPHIYCKTQDFDAKLAVEIRALKKIWHGAINTASCQELKDPADYDLLDTHYYWVEGKYPNIVYTDFIIKNVWKKQSYIHGETWVTLDVESMDGRPYTLSLDTWEFTNPYEFGVGQRYTLFVGLSSQSGGIIYAVQRSVSEQFNSRGEVQPIDYPTDNWRKSLSRVEPEGEGKVYNVSFMLDSQSYGEQFAALEGHGLGEKQWPSDPAWEGYTFIGWYDNLDWIGEPYTKDTPIYHDTTLCARWKYSGTGGIWPRVHHGEIQGIEEDSSISAGQKITITAIGYNMNLESPKDQRFRWKPVAFRLSDGTSGSFTDEAPFQASILSDSKGEQRLYITYEEEVFDCVEWQKTGQVREVEEVTFRVD